MKPEELKKIREDLGLTQKDLAEALGTAQARLSEWERGTAQISAAYVSQIRRLVADRETLCDVERIRDALSKIALRIDSTAAPRKDRVVYERERARVLEAVDRIEQRTKGVLS